jgi:hypothetical protein
VPRLVRICDIYIVKVSRSRRDLDIFIWRPRETLTFQGAGRNPRSSGRGFGSPPASSEPSPPCDQRALWKSGISLWKGQYDAFVAPLTLAPYSKNRIRGLRGGSYGPDHALARVDAQPGNVGRDCPCDGHVPRMRTSLGVKVEGADRPGRSCFRLWGRGTLIPSPSITLRKSPHLPRPPVGPRFGWEAAPAVGSLVRVPLGDPRASGFR